MLQDASSSKCLQLVSGWCSAVAGAMAFAGLARVHDGQTAGQQAVGRRAGIAQAAFGREKDRDPLRGELLQGARPDAAHHDGSHSKIAQVLHRYHAATGLMARVGHGFDVVHGAIGDMEQGIAVAVAKMIRSLCFEPAGVVGGYGDLSVQHVQYP